MEHKGMFSKNYFFFKKKENDLSLFSRNTFGFDIFENYFPIFTD